MALPPGEVVGYIFVEGLFYGLYLSTLFYCLRWLVFTDEGWKVRKGIRWTILSITISLCVLSTISKALDVQDSMDQVVNASKPKLPPPPRTVFSANFLPWMDVVKCTDANVSTLLADAILIYRCWVIYTKSAWVIVFPIFLWMGGLVLTILQAYWQIVQSASVLKAWQPVNMNVGPGTILMPFWASTIILNGYSTFMIVRRIYLVAKESEGSTSIHQLKFAMRILIESGFLYLAAAIAHFVSWWTPNTYAIDIISAIVSLLVSLAPMVFTLEFATNFQLMPTLFVFQNLSVTGIAFNLILIRAAQHRAEEATKGAHLEPISGIQFNVNETKSPGGQIGADPTEAIAFRRLEDSNSIIHSSAEFNV